MTGKSDPITICFIAPKAYPLFNPDAKRIEGVTVLKSLDFRKNALSGRRRAEAFTWNSVADEYLACYKKVAGQTQQGS